MNLVKHWLQLILLIIVPGLLSACGGGGGGGDTSQAIVPNVVGMSQSAAQSAITAAGLTVSTVTNASSTSVAPGNVISQTPAASTSVSSGSSVSLTVSSGPPTAAVPNVVRLTQSAASTAITGAGFKVGTVTLASSSTVPAGSVISQTPAGGTDAPKGAAVALTISNGPPPVKVPNVVGLTQSAATSAITSAGLTLGTVTMASSPTVAAGTVISESPQAGADAAAGSAVALTVSTGPASNFAYVSNDGDGTISAYSVDSTGALTALLSSPISPPGANQLWEIKIDLSHKYLYVLNYGDSGVYAFAVSASDGSLNPVTGSPFQTGNGPQSLEFDASGSYLYVANQLDNTISAFAVNASTGELSELPTSPYAISGTNPTPAQISRAGNFLYVANSNANSVDVFKINPGTGVLTEGVTGSPFTTDTGPFSVATNPAGTVLYTVNLSTGTRTISAFTIDGTTGVLAPVSGNPQTLPALNYLTIDPQGKFLLVTQSNAVSVYPFDASTGVIGTAVTGSPFACGNNPFSITVDPSNRFVYVGNDASQNVSEFTMDKSTGVLTPVAGSPVAAGVAPDLIAFY